MIKTHQRRQVMYSLDIGSPDKNFNSKHPAIENVAGAVSKLVGGCTVIDSIGYWADVQKADRESYNDVAIGQEHNVQLQIKAELHKEKELEKILVGAMVTVGVMWPELGFNWVCGHKVTADGLTVAFNFALDENK